MLIRYPTKKGPFYFAGSEAPTGNLAHRASERPEYY